MGLFKKKSDPVSERAKDLDHQIAALEAEIKKLSVKASAQPAAMPESSVSTSTSMTAAAPRAPGSPPPPAPTSAQHLLRPDSPSAIPKFTSGENPAPRLRSTALPHRPPSVNPTADSHDPVFEEVNQPPIKAETEPPAATPEALGTRQSDFASFWRRIVRNFRGPVTSNPKLVNYLAAGSIQGLQPLRYEKRVARNRFIVFAGVLLAALWGLIAMLISRR